jgi:hypothetical protein
LEPVKLNGKVLMRISVGKMVMVTQSSTGATVGLPYHSKLSRVKYTVKGEIHCFLSTSLAGMTVEPGAAHFMGRDYTPVGQLKPGSQLVTSPSFVYRWGKDAVMKDLPK